MALEVGLLLLIYKLPICTSTLTSTYSLVVSIILKIERKVIMIDDLDIPIDGRELRNVLQKNHNTQLAVLLHETVLCRKTTGFTHNRGYM